MHKYVCDLRTRYINGCIIRIVTDFDLRDGAWKAEKAWIVHTLTAFFICSREKKVQPSADARTKSNCECNATNSH